MNTRMINHDDAVKDLMAERYLLGELNTTERDAYEQHLFSCDACFEQVKAGTEFVTHLRHIGTEAPQAPLLPGFMSRLMTSARQPLTITVLGFLLFASGVAIHQGSVIAHLKEPRPEIRSVLTGVAHGSSDIQSDQGSQKLRPESECGICAEGRIYLISGTDFVEFRKSAAYSRAAGNSSWNYSYHSSAGRCVETGQYSMVVFGRRSDGTQEEVGRGAFELQFTDN